MASCQECNAEVASGKKLCEECAKKKIAEMDEPIEEETVEAVDEDVEEESEEEIEEVESEEDTDCTPQSDRINRIIAAAIDGVLAAVIFGILYTIIGKIPIVRFLAPYVVSFAMLAFLALRDVLFDSQSPGKKILGFKVIKIGEEKREIGTMTSVLRNMPFLLFSVINTFVMLIPLLPFKWIFTSMISICGMCVACFELFLIFSNGKRFGDKLGRTKVVKN